MKRNVRTALLFVVLLVLTVSSLFAAQPVFDDTNITTVPGTGATLVIGSTITVTVVDVNNSLDSSLQFDSATVDLTQFGGSAAHPMTRSSDAPGQGEWQASYTIKLGDINASNRSLSVTAKNGNDELTVTASQRFTVNNIPPMNNTDMTGTPYLRVNDNVATRQMKSGDTIHLIATFKSHIDKVWVNWGATFTGAPVIEYQVAANGTATISYTPASGSLPLNYVTDLKAVISKMQSKTIDGYGPYESAPAWSREVSKTYAGQDIAADLNPPNLIGAWDLYYDVSKPLRFSPDTDGFETYNTLPNTFDIYLKLPDWRSLGGANQFTLLFETENRSSFQKTITLSDNGGILEELGSGVLKVTWDGKDNAGVAIAPGLTTIIGVTLVEVKDYVGNTAILHRVTGGEFSHTGDITDPADHTLIHNSAIYTLAHEGQTIKNRIHTILDEVAPQIAPQPRVGSLTLQGQPEQVSQLSIIRLINDDNNDNIWDPGEAVHYTYEGGLTAPSSVAYSFAAIRDFTTDTNPLRHEELKYWLVLEREGGAPADKWYWTGSNWNDYSLFNQNTNAHNLSFLANLDATSQTEYLNWTLGTAPGGIFTGSALGQTYHTALYVQDNAGNIQKASENVSITIKDIYMNIPTITGVSVISEHATVAGGLDVVTAGVKNFYLSSRYVDSNPGYSGPFDPEDEYYNTSDNVVIEVTVNDRDYLRDTNSVEVRLTQLGVPNPVVRYLNKNQFDATNKATITIPVSTIPIGKAATGAGKRWKVGGNNGASNYIQVISHAIPYPIGGTSVSQSFDAADEDQFNLVIPPAPQYPDPDPDAYLLAASNPKFSPGIPYYVYDSVTNPAHDGLKDDTNLSFVIPTGDNLNWELEIADDGTAVRSWTGHLGVSQTPASISRNFNGLKADLSLIADATVTKPLTATLKILPQPMSDPGYVAPPANIYPNIPLVIDNTNPKLVSGTGTAVDPTTRQITLTGPIPVVTEVENTLEFTVYATEELNTDLSDPNGWKVKVIGNNNQAINNGLNDVAARVTGVTRIGTTQNYTLVVEFDHLAGTLTHEHAHLVLMLPWDDALNPGRYNTPSYPYNGDVFHHDSSEYYLDFNILDAKPRIESITFEHRGVIGEAKKVGANWNAAFTQAYVGPTVTGQQSYTLTAEVHGGAYRAMATNWTADLRPLLGTAAANAAVAPTAVSTADPVNENRVWTLTWTGTIPNAISNAWAHNSIQNIPISIVTADNASGFGTAHQEARNINIKVDKQAPNATNSTTAIVADGSAKPMSFSVNDPDSGMDFATETLALNPNTDMSITKINNGQWNITIPSGSAVKHFVATYKVKDKMGNEQTLTRYINVDPVPHLTNVALAIVPATANNPDLFVPGKDLVVTWNLNNSQRATGGQIVLTSTVAVTGGTVNLSAAQLATGSYTFTSFYNNNTNLDNRALTATVTGYTTGYTAPTAATTANRTFTYGTTTATDNVDTITVDSKPVITAVSFKRAGATINTLLPGMDGITIEATVTSINNLDPAQTTIAMTTPSGTLTGSFVEGTLSIIPGTGNTKTLTWTNASFTGLAWTPVSDTKIARFNVNTKTIYGYAANQYTHDMAVMRMPNKIVQGKVGSRAAYTGTDPDGWFAPEHLVHTEYDFITTINQTDYPPIEADFDLIEDNITNNWRQPQAIGTGGSTRTPVNVTLTRGGSTTTVTVYKYNAKWVVQPDFQSVWNAYDDGQAVPISFKYTQMTGTISDSYSIKVDKSVPQYEDYLWIATGTTTPTSYQPYHNGFPGTSPDITLALNPNGSWPAGQKVYLKYTAKDTGGVGAMDVANPTVSAGWTVAQVAHNITPPTLNYGIVEKIVSLTPTNPSNIGANSSFIVSFGRAQDAVGHVNYGTPANSTDPNWTGTAPTQKFVFSADYVTSHQMLRGYKYLAPDRMDDKTAPYVQAGAPMGVMLELAPIDPRTRGADVQDITVSSVELNTRYITNVSGGTDTWVTMAKDATTGIYYLNNNVNVNANHAHGAGIDLQYRINYLITYTDGTTSVPPALVSALQQNVVQVDKLAPTFVFDGNPSNPANQRSIFYWSETIGSAQEGYVVPGDTDGQMRIIFKDNSGYVDPNAVPNVVIGGLDQFVVGMPASYTVAASELTHHATYSLDVKGTTYNYSDVWVAALSGLNIKTKTTVPYTSATVNYALTDVVGNGPLEGNRMVEIAANGPIVPVIREARLATVVPGTGDTIYNYLASGVPATMQVFIDAEYAAYIENVWIDPITGVSYAAPTIPVKVNHATHNVAGISHDLWMVNIGVTPTNVAAYNDINFVVHTKRNPFGVAVFTGTYNVPVIVDGKTWDYDNSVVTGISSFGNHAGMLGPNADASIVATFSNIGEQVVVDGVQALPANIEDWFTLQNAAPAAFANIPTPTIQINGTDVVATWTFDSTDINQALAADVNSLNFTVKYQNIWGFEKTTPSISFDFDQKVPVIDNIVFYEGATVSQTENFDALNYIANNQDWTKIRFNLSDPFLRGTVPGSGIEDIQVTFTRAAETYTPTPDPILNMTGSYNAVENYFELTFNAGFSAFDLAEGYYNFAIYTTDGLDNYTLYNQSFLYWHHPAVTEIVPEHDSDVYVLKDDGSINQVKVTAFPGDAAGQVQAVQFFLYEDVDKNGTYEAAIDIDRTADLTNEAGGAIDTQAPYTVMWDFNGSHYKYLENAVYNRDASRQFLLRASVLSEGSRAVTDSIVVINVIDNQPPVPNAPTVAGNQTFNYIDTTQNVLNLNVSFDAQWIDAEVATFVITKADGSPVTTIDANVAGFAANATWIYNGQDPGDFLVSVIGKDFVGNVSAAVEAAAPVSIQNPASLISYNMIMSDVQGFNNATPISNGTIYGYNNPVEAVGSLRLETQFYSNTPSTPSLEGIQDITFKARVTNNVTGDVSVIDLVNDIALQPDYPATGAILVDPQIINNSVTLFIPDNFYMVAGYDTQDISYEFFVELNPIHPAVLQAPVYTGIRLDYYAPVVSIAEATEYITWSKNNEFKITGDVADVATIKMMWSKDDTNWLDAQDINHALLPYIVNADPSDTYIKFANWNTAGGSLQSLLDYEGAAWIKVIAADARGNVGESASVELYVDNVAPQTPVTHVAYRTLPEVEAGEAAGAYNGLHALGTLTGEANNTITMVTSAQGEYGTSTLRIYVDPTQITGTSTEALGAAHAWNNMASWYNGTNDFRPPLRLYHGFSATGDVNNISWTTGEMYDHETWDGMYGFDIPVSLVSAEGTHYFIVGATDTRGNVEGDFADDLQAFNGLLDPTERIAAIDLTVNVVNIADVQMQVVYPADNAIVGEWLNLAANITSNVGGTDVNEVIFQRKVGANWEDMATVARANTSNVHFHLYRKDIPQYDGLPYVPGVHLFVDGVEQGELAWNAATQSWYANFPLALGSYNFEYYLDLNNDGIINNLDDNIALQLGGIGMRSVMDPNGFTNFTVTPWVYSFNSEDIIDGLYEFRVVPIDAADLALFNHVSPSTWLHIDNTAPDTVIESVGGIERIRVAHDPNNVDINYELVKLAADVNELLVAYDDIIEVSYQYSAQVPAAPIRRWIDFDNSNTMAGNYMVDFAVGLTGGIVAPNADGIDNDNDGLVDEADEAEITYYLRAVAKDKAGNYFTSNVIEIEVDGHAPIMQVRDINGVLMADTQNIFTIPTQGDVVITAFDITGADFDAATYAYFEYKYRATVNDSWSAVQPFDASNVWQPVVNGSASQVLPAALVREGYYGFRAVARDLLNNIDIASAPFTYVVFDDVNGSQAHIVSLGVDPQNNNLPILVVSDEYAFARSYAHYNGPINIGIDNPTEINTITARWAENLNGPWVNINTVAVNNQALVSIPWITPILTRAPYIYLQISAQDIYANTESSEIVKLYVDTVAPGADVVSLTHIDAEGKKAINKATNLDIVLSYTNLNNDDLLDVKDVDIRILDLNDAVIVRKFSTYTGIAKAATNFRFLPADLAILTDGIYHLELVLHDFAGNEAVILPADYQALYIDTTAPAALSIASTNFPGGIAPYNSTINFKMDYTDLIGVSATNAFSATFSYQGVSQVVNTYDLDSDPSGTWIEFAWIPSADFQQLFAEGEMEINLMINAQVADLLGNAGTAAENFKLTYGVPNTTRIMVVTDYEYDVANAMYVDRPNMVNWNLATPQVVAQIGTNQNAAQPLELYAYVAHLSEIPTQVDFEWLDESLPVPAWVAIGSQTVGNQWSFVHPQFLASYQREYTVAWDISGMPTGDYQVRTRSHHAAGISESTITLHIYNDTIVPSFAIEGIQNGEVERGETYTLNVANFVGDASMVQGLRFKYRYIDENDSPTSEWMFFGNSNGSFNDAWIQGDFSFDWTVYPFYLFNNRVQIIAYAMDFWGTETPIAAALSSSQYANIVNRLAPSVSGIKVDWAAIATADAYEHEAVVKATINTSSAPSDLVSVSFLHKLNGATDFSDFDTQSGWTQAQMTTDLALVSAPFNYNNENLVVTGEIKVVSTDVFGNTNEAVFDLADLPIAGFAVSANGETITDKLERESTVLLDADPSLDIVSAQYHWDTIPGAVTGPVWIGASNDDPYTFQWDVPVNWTFGEHYQLIATVNDAAGNSFSHARSFEITDHTTDIVIDTVAGQTPTSIGIILPRLHGDIPVAITVNDVAIPRVEFMIRPAAENADWESVAFVNIVSTSFTYIYDELDALPSGQYYLGVRAAAARNGYPVISDQVLVTIDNEIDIAVTSYLPETNGFFNGDEYIVNFTVANEDEINERNLRLQYNTATEPNWMGGNIASYTTSDGIHYTATFTNVVVPVDGYYNFRFVVEDTAIPTPNVLEIALAQNVLVDTVVPNVAMISIDGETNLTLPIDIELGTQVDIIAYAYDVLGGQIHQVASGMDKVEFLIDGTVMGEVVVRDRSREVYSFVWNTLGYEINTSHTVQAIAYDKAGNPAATATYPVNLVAPVGLEAFAMITAMDFDASTANNDHIYAVVRDWPATGATPTVTFEYFNGTAWSHFANAANFGAYYRANFNAELMANATALRAVVNGNYNAPMPEVAVSYNAADASLVVVDPAISADIFYANELRITEVFADTPIVTALQGGAPVMSTPYMMNGNQVVDIAINNIGTHTFWAAVLDNNGNVQLGKTVVETVNNGTASDNGISYIVPNGGFGYFQNVAPAIALPEGFVALSPQHAFFAHDNTGALVPRDLTIAISTPATQGNLVAMYYNAATGLWSAPMPAIDNNDGTVSVAGVPSGTVVSVMQYTGVGIHAMFNAINPVYVSGTNLWTTAAPTINFFIYEGMDANGYIIPGALSSLTLYLDEVAVAPTVAFNPTTGLVSYSAAGLEAGAHTISIVVEQNGFTATASQDFFVDITAPVIVANSGQITSTNRVISASITDAETGILDASLLIGGIIPISMNQMTVAGNNYSYNITDEDLFTLGYSFSNAMALDVRWNAKNNLDLASPAVTADYTVNITAPGIVFTGFDNGWWINPTQNTPLTFNVIAPQGHVIDDNILITLEEMINDPVNGNYTNIIQTMEVNPVSVTGQSYSYSVNFGYSVAPNAHAIKLIVNAWDNYNVQSSAEQTYGIDYLAPIVWAISPVGAPIDPDAFPVTYESAVIPYGTPATIAVGFQDMQGFVTQDTGEWYWVGSDNTWHNDYLVYYTGASGLDLDNVNVRLDGAPITGTITGGAFIAPAGDLAPGLHTVIATVADNAGNVGSLSYTFTVTGGTPAITFTGVNGVASDFWLNSTNNNQLGFTVDTVANVGIESVVANIYAEPADFIIQGPITPAPNGNAYSINLLGGIVPAGQYAVRLEVTATTVLGTSATSTQTYGIDNDAPVITLVSPAEASVFAPEALVNILAQITDQMAAKAGALTQSRSLRESDKGGSGLQSVKLSVFSPSGTDLMADVDIPAAQVIAQSISGNDTAELGTYNIVLIATDKAGNQSMLTRSFMVAPTTGPTVSFAEHSGWLIANGMNNLQFTVGGEGILSVSAKVYANPSDALLMGPLAVQPTSGVYTVSVNGNMIPADQTSIRLEVTVNDQYGHESIANYYYNVDKVAPTITILSPAEGAQITRVDNNTVINIEAQFADLMLGENASTGSGIASSRLVVIGPDGTQIGAAVETGAGIAETTHQLSNLALGNYTARLTVQDNAGNQSVATVNFTVVDTPAPPVTLDITEAHIFPNPSSADTGARFSVSVTAGSTVSIRIYDFAGREVRTMNYAAKSNGKSVVDIHFDGRSNDGVKLARGSYYARVIANDGTKTVEKVVKVAIRK